MQASFNPINYGFEWTAERGDCRWYKWDGKAAHSEALKARNAKAKELKAKGHNVRKSSTPNQLISRGGIGSGHPHIESIVTIYNLSY